MRDGFQVTMTDLQQAAGVFRTEAGTFASTTSWHIVVNTSQRRVRVYLHGHVVRTIPVVVGAPSPPTPRPAGASPSSTGKAGQRPTAAPARDPAHPSPATGPAHPLFATGPAHPLPVTDQAHSLFATDQDRPAAPTLPPGSPR